MITVYSGYIEWPGEATSDDLLREASRIADALLEVLDARDRGAPFEIVVQVEPGSKRIWIWIKRAGKVLIIYGGLRTGLDYAVEDFKYLREVVPQIVSESIFRPDEALPFESPGVPGRLDELLRMVAEGQMGADEAYAEALTLLDGVEVEHAEAVRSALLVQFEALDRSRDTSHRPNRPRSSGALAVRRRSPSIEREDRRRL